MTTYYVDATDGDDTRAGTSEGTAWKTIGKVNSSAFLPGDSVVFKRGETWSGTTLTVPSSGSHGSPITFGAYGSGALPVLTANDAVQRGILCQGKAHVDFEHLDIRAGRAYGIDIQSSYVEIRDCRVSGCGDDNVTIGPNAHDVLVQGVVSFDPYEFTPGPTIACIEIQDGAYNVELRDCECYGSEMVGINVNAHEGEILPYSITIRRCYCHDNANSGIVCSNSGTLQAPAIEIRDCRSIDNGYIGLDIYNGGAGLDPQNILVRGCIIAGNTSYQVRISGDRHLYRQNVFSGRNGVLILDATNLGFYNNTIYNAEVGTVFAFTGTDNSGTVAKNNIICTLGTGNNSVFVAAGAQAGLDIDYNLYYHIDGADATRWYWNGSSYNWANWKTNSSQDANSPAPAIPLFENVPADDFRLKAGSPAIGAGVDVGLFYSGDAPDCGAYERWASRGATSLHLAAAEEED